MKNGFTLVELSIVLVIIGLLIGGILVGQSLIDSAKTQSQVRQIQQFDIAVEQFKSRYNQLPGDSNLFTNKGDNDGYLEERPAAVDISDFTEELAYFWEHLSQSNILQENYVAALSGSINGGNNNTPQSIFTEEPIIAATVSVGRHKYFIGGFLGNGDTFDAAETTGSLTPITALALDSKMDDGIANTGDFDVVDLRSDINTNSVSGTEGSANCVITGTNAYNVTYNADEVCIAGIDMLTTSGGN